MSKHLSRVLIAGSVFFGTVGVGFALVLGSTLADVVLTISAAIGLAFLLFWFEQQWSQRAGEIEQRTDDKIESVRKSLTQRIDDTLTATTNAARKYVETQAAIDRQLLDQYLASPTSDGLLELCYRVAELDLERPRLATRYRTAADPAEGAIPVADRRLGNIEFRPDRRIDPVKRDATLVNVTVSQPISGPNSLPSPPKPIDVAWTTGMTVEDLTNALLSSGLAARSHLWPGAEQFGAVLADALANAGQTLFDEISTQFEGHPVSDLDG